MIFILGVSLDLFALLPYSPIFWVACGVIGAVAFAAHRDRLAGPTLPLHRLFEFGLLYIFPPTILAYGLAFWERGASSARNTGAQWLAAVLPLLALAEFLLTLALLYRHRRRLPAALLVSLGALAWTYAAFFAAGMALSGDWL